MSKVRNIHFCYKKCKFCNIVNKQSRKKTFFYKNFNLATLSMSKLKKSYYLIKM